MKKLMVIVLAGMMCCASTGYAQSKKETVKEKVVRLEVENRALLADINQLEQEINTLKQQIGIQVPDKQKSSAQVQNISFRPIYITTPQIGCDLFTFGNMEKWASSMYVKNNTFRIIDTQFSEEREYVTETTYLLKNRILRVTYTVNGIEETRYFSQKY